MRPPQICSGNDDPTNLSIAIIEPRFNEAAANLQRKWTISQTIETKMLFQTFARGHQICSINNHQTKPLYPVSTPKFLFSKNKPSFEDYQAMNHCQSTRISVGKRRSHQTITASLVGLLYSFPMLSTKSSTLSANPISKIST